jgi:hypothetical protein
MFKQEFRKHDHDMHFEGLFMLQHSYFIFFFCMLLIFGIFLVCTFMFIVFTGLLPCIYFD